MTYNSDITCVSICATTHALSVYYVTHKELSMAPMCHMLAWPAAKEEEPQCSIALFNTACNCFPTRLALALVQHSDREFNLVWAL